ncbi:MAG: response regulator [Dactylosporangium sp.]|nr:response regulator [Dactylosporangium sp.]NNJ62381.1 response regulator [Dactylosporangium sp.]
MASTRQLPRVLFVDDQERLLEGLSRQVRGVVESVLITSPRAAAELLEHPDENGDFAAIVSDMRMPEMDGAALLKHAKSVCPDTTRLLLTGYTDINHAISAVNEGNIFRFLTKPCSTANLRLALDDAINQHLMLRDRRDLLERTLRGAIEALVETLTMAHPAAFARASRLRRLVRETADRMGMSNPWQIEAAAQLGEIGVITLPPEALEALTRGSSSNAVISRMLDELPELADDVLKRIPRLENVRAIVRAQQPVDHPDLLALAEAGQESRLLQAVREYDALTVQGYQPTNALGVMAQHGFHDPYLLNAIRTVVADGEGGEIREVEVEDLQPGLLLAADLRSRKGMLLVKNGHVLTTELLARIRNFDRLGGLERRPLVLIDKK